MIILCIIVVQICRQHKISANLVSANLQHDHLALHLDSGQPCSYIAYSLSYDIQLNLLVLAKILAEGKWTGQGSSCYLGH